MFFCDICQKSFKTRKNLRDHKSRSHDTPKFACSICGQVFRKLYLAKRHMERQHSDYPDKVFIHGRTTKCSWCSQSFQAETEFPLIRRHLADCKKNPLHQLRLRHPSFLVGNVACDVCGARFSNNKNLKLHKRRKHLTQSQGGCCDVDWAEDDDQNWEDIDVSYDNTEALLQGTLDPERLYRMVSDTESYNFKFSAEEKRKQFFFSGFAKKLCSQGFQIEVIEMVIGHLIGNLQQSHPLDIIYVALDSPMVLDFPVSRKFNSVQNFSVEGIIDEVRRLLQSKEKLGIHGPFLIDIKHVKGLVQGGHIGKKRSFRNTSMKSIVEWLTVKLGCIDPYKFTKKDPQLSNSYFPLSLAIALTSGCPDTTEMDVKRKKWFKTSKLTNQIKRQVRELYHQANLPYNSPVTSEDFDTFHDILSNNYGRQLVVYEATAPSNKTFRILYSGKPDKAPFERICLMYYGGHFWLIDRLSLAGGRGKQLCTTCGFLIGDRRQHTCNKKCSLCLTKACYKRQSYRGKIGKVQLNAYCERCNRFFHSSYCAEMHRTNEICQSFARCEICLRVVRREVLIPPQEHECSLQKCYHCKLTYSVFDDHHCYIQPPKKSFEVPEGQLYISLDFETITDINGIHTPNLATIFICCPSCLLNFDSETPVPCCGNRKVEIFAIHVVQATVDCLFFDNKKKDAIVLAHYTSKFDSHFILNELTNRGITPQVICRGSQIIQLTGQNNVTLKDSYLFFHCALDKLSKMFSLPTVKGFFPHSFNSPSNYDYVGPIPAKKYFEPWKMKGDRLTAFSQWYSRWVQLGKIWRFREELSRYGWADTILVSQSCAIFRRDMMRMTGICPFYSSMTIAQYSTLVLRANFLPHEKFPILLMRDNESVGFLREKASQIAIKYLAWESKQKGIKIRTAGNSASEARIGGWKIDGRHGATLYEVHGCFWHACPSCYGQFANFKHPARKGTLTYKDVRFKTMWKERCLRELGYDVRVIWECSINKQLTQNPTMHQFFNDEFLWRHLREPIKSARDGYYGGRVETSVLLAHLDKELLNAGFSVLDMDINSLYPKCMQSFDYPYDTFEILNGRSLPSGPFTLDVCKQFFGLMKIYVVPPFRLLHPVLPYRNEKTGHLLFPLCKQCSIEMCHEQDCTHFSAEERGWVSTYCSPEIIKAIQNGYTVESVIEIWNFPKRTDQLFKDFIRSWAKIKYANSGWPKDQKYDCTSLEGKLQYLRDMQAKENIKLDVGDIQDNISLRSEAKLAMNSSYGKFAQSGVKNNNHIEYVTDPAVLRKFIHSPSISINYCHFIDTEVAMVQYSKQEDFIKPHAISNAVIASFITTYARLELLKGLELLGFAAWYWDTDSIFHLTKEGWPKLEEGPYFGQYKSELSLGEIIAKWVSLGPKTLAYLTNLGREELRTKGISLDWITGQLFNFDSMVDILLGHTDDLISIYDQMKDQELAERLRFVHGEITKVSRREDVGVPSTQTIGGGDPKSILVVPTRQIKRDIKSATLKNLNHGTKRVQLQFKKRRICAKSPIDDVELWGLGNAIRTVPWGYVFE